MTNHTWRTLARWIVGALALLAALLVLAVRGLALRVVIALLAAALDVPARHIQIIRGHAQPRKTLRVEGWSQAQLDEKLGKLFG